MVKPLQNSGFSFYVNLQWIDLFNKFDEQQPILFWKDLFSSLLIT